MSTPHQGPGRIRRMAAGVSRWRHTRRGTKTLKAAYAQAARDVKRMDPAVRAAVGRSGLTKADLKNLAQANTAAIYGPQEARVAAQINAVAAAQVQAATPAAQRTRNPFKQLSNWASNRRDIRQGTKALKAGFAQAARDVKRMDPAVREAIGRSPISKQDLKLMSQGQVAGVIQTGVAQAAQQHQAAAQARAAAQAARGGPRAHAAPSQSAGQRVANAVNTASRWAKAVKTYPTEKARKFLADYTERRQNPIGRNAGPQATPQGQRAQAQAQAAQTAQPSHAQMAQPAQPAQTAQPAQAAQTGPAAQTPQPAQTAQTGPAAQPGQAAQAAQPNQGAATQTPDEWAQLVKTADAGFTPSVPNPAAATADARRTPDELRAGQRFAELVSPAENGTAAEAAESTAAPAGNEKSGGGRHAADRAASAAFSGVAPPAGATQPVATHQTGGQRPETGRHSVDTGKHHHKPNGREQ
jgi:hypothetical protein